MEKKSNKGLIVLVIIFGIIILGLSGFIIYDKVIKNDDTKTEDKNNTEEKQEVDNNDKQEETDNKEDSAEDISNTSVKYNKFSFESFNIDIISKLNNLEKIYAFDISRVEENEKAYEIIARYEDGSKTKLATVSQYLEYRTLDIENNKLYFIISGDYDSMLFELYYIDLNNLENKPVKLEDFSNKYKESSKFCIDSTKCSAYPTLIYVKNDLIYYTQYAPSLSILKTYNINTGEIKTISSISGWFDFTVDKINNKIFYSAASKLIVADLDGSNKIYTDINVDSSDFFTRAYYDKSIVIEEDSLGAGNSDMYITDLYKFNYKNNTLELLKQDISSSYYITPSQILDTKDKNIIYTYYVAK